MEQYAYHQLRIKGFLCILLINSVFIWLLVLGGKMVIQKDNAIFKIRINMRICFENVIGIQSN